MDAKLKALRVTDLKEILSKASITPGNAKKQDLINRILANPPAIDIFHSLHPATKHKNSKQVPVTPNDDLLAPPEEVDWTVEDSTQLLASTTNLNLNTPSPQQQQQQQQQPPPKSKQPLSSPAKPLTSASVPVIAPPTNAHPTVTDPLDEEEAKHKARATRFNTPYVEPKKAKSDHLHEIGDKLTEDSQKLNARGLRSGDSMTKTNRKRVVPVEEVDPEEQERRRKRAERFGLTNATTNA